MPEIDSVSLLALSLFGLTAVLLLAATRFGQTRTGRILALAAIGTVIGADHFMMQSYRGEKEFITQHAGPIERRVIQRRGSFEYVDKEDGSASDGGGGSGSSAASATGSGSADGGSEGGTGNGSGSTGSGAGSSRGAPSRFSQLLDKLMPAAFAARRNGDAARDCEHCPEMVVVAPGYFRMGAAPGDADAQASEYPSRMVRVTAVFAIGRSEITVAQYMAFASATGRSVPDCVAGRSGNPRAPAACVSWRDAVDYVAWLNAMTGRTYRLPSEAEWEWAARGGSAGRYFTADVPAKAVVNAFGLANIHGGVAEIVVACWTETLGQGLGRPSSRPGTCRQRVLRDAGDGEPRVLSRLSARRAIDIDERRPQVGFRVARDL